MKIENNLRKEPSFWLWAGIPAAICIALLWLPFGLSLGGLIEEWDFFWYINRNPGFWNSFPGHVLSKGFAARPLHTLPLYLAHAISSHSFLGLHILLIIVSFLRITAVAYIGHFIFNNRFYALTLGLLAFLLPADTQQLTFRTIFGSGALSLMLCSAALALMAIKETRLKRRWLTLAGSMFLAIIAAWIYEAVIALYSIPPLALFARYDLKTMKEIFQRMRIEIVVWMLAPLLNIVYFSYILIIYKSGYHDNLAHDHNKILLIIHHFHYLLDSAVFRIFYDGWIAAAQILLQEVVKWPYLLTSLVVILLMLWIGGGQPQRVGKPSSVWSTLGAGIVLFTVAYLPFMLSGSHVLITQRTMMFSSFGASIIIVTIIAALLNKKRIITTLLITTLLFIGFVAQIYQIDNYTRAYVDIIRPYMSLVADLSNPGKKTHLVIDRVGMAGHLNGMFTTKITMGIAVRLDQTDHIYFTCKDVAPSPLMIYNQCKLQGDFWSIIGVSGHEKIPASEVDVIVIDDNNFNPNYRSRDSRWRDLGNFKSKNSIFAYRSPTANWYSCIADSMWGYSNFCRGEGWTDGSYAKHNLTRTNYFSSMQPTASLNFNMKPSAKDYQLQVKLSGSNNSIVLPQLRITINGREVPFKLKANDSLEAKVLGSMLKKGLNNLEFNNTLANQSITGLSFEQLILAPIGSHHFLW